VNVSGVPAIPASISDAFSGEPAKYGPSVWAVVGVAGAEQVRPATVAASVAMGGGVLEASVDGAVVPVGLAVAESVAESVGASDAELPAQPASSTARARVGRRVGRRGIGRPLRIGAACPSG